MSLPLSNELNAAILNPMSPLSPLMMNTMGSCNRGFYAGPIGYVSAGGSEFGVAIRSALVTTSWTSSEGLSRTSVAAGASGVAGFVGGCGGERGGGGSEMTLFAGAGIVPGSVALSEWAETGVKVRLGRTNGMRARVRSGCWGRVHRARVEMCGDADGFAIVLAFLCSDGRGRRGTG